MRLPAESTLHPFVTSWTLVSRVSIDFVDITDALLAAQPTQNILYPFVSCHPRFLFTLLPDPYHVEK